MQDCHWNIFILKVCFELFMLYKLYLYVNCCVHCLSLYMWRTLLMLFFRFVSCMLQGTSFLCWTMLFWFTVDWRPLCHFIRPKTWIKKEIVCCFDNLKLNWERNIQNHPGDATDKCAVVTTPGWMHMLKCPLQSDWVNRTSILLLYYTQSGLISVYV